MDTFVVRKTAKPDGKTKRTFLLYNTGLKPRKIKRIEGREQFLLLNIRSRPLAILLREKKNCVRYIPKNFH